MVLASEPPRTSIITFSANFEKCIAAWPAEFAPPTTYTVSPLQALNSGHVERAPLYTHGQQQRVTGNLRAVREFEVAVRAIDANAHGFLGREDLHIKAPCLRHRTTRQIAAAQSRRESQIVFNARAEACLAAGRFALHNHRAQSFRCSINGSGKTRGATADDCEIVKIGLRLGVQTELAGHRRKRRLGEAFAIGEKNQRQSLCFRAQGIEEPAHLGIRGCNLDVDPLVRHLIAAEKIAQFVGPGRPTRAQHANAFVQRTKLSGPVMQQIIERREQFLLWRVPRLHQVVVHARFVNGVDGRIPIGVRKEEAPLCLRMNVHGLREEAYTVHLRHALIGEQQRHGIVAGLQLAQRGQRSATGIRAHHPIAVGIMPAQVALNGAQNLRIVVDCQHHWLWHRAWDENCGALVTCSGGASLRDALTLQSLSYPCPALSPRRSRTFLQVMPSCARRLQRKFIAEAGLQRIARSIRGGTIPSLPHCLAPIRWSLSAWRCGRAPSRASAKPTGRRRYPRCRRIKTPKNSSYISRAIFLSMCSPRVTRKVKGRSRNIWLNLEKGFSRWSFAAPTWIVLRTS